MAQFEDLFEWMHGLCLYKAEYHRQNTHGVKEQWWPEEGAGATVHPSETQLEGTPVISSGVDERINAQAAQAGPRGPLSQGPCSFLPKDILFIHLVK